VPVWEWAVPSATAARPSTFLYHGKLTVSEAFKALAGWDPTVDPDIRRFDEDTVLKVIPNLKPNRPTFLVDYPAPMASLARLKPVIPRGCRTGGNCLSGV